MFVFELATVFVFARCSRSSWGLCTCLSLCKCSCLCRRLCTSTCLCVRWRLCSSSSLRSMF